MLEQISKLSEDEFPAWSEAQTAAVQELTEQLRSSPPAAAAAPETARAPEPLTPVGEVAAPVTAAEVANELVRPESIAPKGERSVAPKGAKSAAPKGSESADRQKQEKPAETATVPVDGERLNRMMQLASEGMIASRRFAALQRVLTRLREVNEQLGKTAKRQDGRRGARGLLPQDLQDLRRHHASAVRLLDELTLDLERAAWRTERLSTELYDVVLSSRMRPFAEGVRAFPRTVRDLSRQLGKKVQLRIIGEAVSVDRDILRKLEAPLNHIIRNCLDHGIETPAEREAAGKPEQGTVIIEARHHAGMLTIEVRDDGRGIDPERIRRRVVERGLVDGAMAANLSEAELLDFLFLPGFSTAAKVTEVSGRGVGLDVVQSMVHEVGGTVRIDSTPGQSTLFHFRLPVTLSVVRAALAHIAGEPYAFPLSRLVRLVRLGREEIEPVEGRQQFQLDGESVGLVNAAEVLGLEHVLPSSERVNVLVIGQGGQLCGLVVDRFGGEQDLVVRPLDPNLGRVAHVSSAALLDNGDPILIIDVDDIFQSVQILLGEGRLRGMRSVDADNVAGRKPRVLVVDDSITVREVERQLLTRHGFDVDVAVDGRDGWNALSTSSYDLLVTDIDMPRMNGIELIRTLRRDPRYKELPVIIVSYKDREEDRMLGLEVGANAYLTKGSFHDESLVTMVTDLIGDPTVRIALVNDLKMALIALQRVIESIPGARIAWTAADGAQALDRCRADTPDLILMDMIMPVMDGVEATRLIMKECPCPIVVVTATVTGNANLVYEALGHGALDAVNTPVLGTGGDLSGADDLIRKIRVVERLQKASADGNQRFADVAASPRSMANTMPPLVAIGASTGGPQALVRILSDLPHPLLWAIVIVQHIDPVFAPGLAKWLAEETSLDVEVAHPGEPYAMGTVAVANTDDHLVVDRNGRYRHVKEPAEQVYRPSVDVFFHSLLQAGVAPAVAVLLTGMGRDGAAGLLALRRAGWHTIAQDRATSVVWGMPGAAVELRSGDRDAAPPIDRCGHRPPHAIPEYLMQGTNP